MKEIVKNSRHRRVPIAFIIWVVFFCYAICAALIFQKALFPLVLSFHSGVGLMNNDAVFFDSVAVTLAEQIHLHGWGVWQLFPVPGAAGNVGILAALYAVFGHDPTLIIPVNAAIHALGGVLIYLLARELSDKESIGTYAGIIAASLFIIFPSALNWYGQVHKDGYAIAGTLLILLAWVKAVRGCPDIRGWLRLLLLHFSGIILVGIVRPYGLRLILVATLAACLGYTLIAVLRHQFRREIKLILFLLATAATLQGGIIVTNSLNPQLGETYGDWQSKGQWQWQWQDNPWLPNNIENYLELASRTRAGLIEYGISEHAKSMIDEDIAPQNAGEVLVFLPRALQISIFSPFPTSWLTNLSVTRLVAAGEMFIYYLCLPGVLLLLLYNRSRAMWLCIFFASFFLLIQGFTIANMGTLYRVRYAYIFVLAMLGIVGWLTWLDRTGRLKRLVVWMSPSGHLMPSGNTPEEIKLPARKEALGSGLWVMALTFLCFVGFFIRDIMMAHSIGLGSDLDNFYVALTIPMFIVAVLCMPLGAAFIPAYLEIKERVSLLAAKSLVTKTSSWATAVLLLICLTLYLTGPTLLPMFYFKDAIPNIGQLIVLLDAALPLLLFSGMVILGNAVLNAKGRAVLSSAAQLVVPIVAILSLVLFGERYGVQAVMYGMVAGQLLNLFIVQYYLRHQDVCLWPRVESFRPSQNDQAQISPLLALYLPLVASAFFISIAAPVSTMLAMSLPEGAVSAFNLGNKVVLFVTGLVGTAIGTVMLPYFSAMISKNHMVAARRELSLFLLFATFVSVPISAVMYVWAGPIIRMIFEGGTFDSNATVVVTRVMQYAVVQLPFFVCNSLLLRYATAAKHVFAISVTAIIGLLVNVGVSLILMKHMGVAGIALGTTVSMLASTVLLTLVLVRYWHITRFDALVMLMNWLLYGTLLIGVHFGSLPSVVVTILAYMVLLAGYFKSWSFDEFPKLGMRN